MALSPVMDVGVVVIGRNEGHRLGTCLRSVPEVPTVYVDSGSTDGSLALARKLNVRVLRLNVDIPFTAARARNAGFRQLRAMAPDLRYVQFIDGDCEIDSGWLPEAARFLSAHEDVAVVSGRLRERNPERTIYNMLCDLEWEMPPGEARSCGGVAMIRISAFESVDGFRGDLIAGEEPELCVRLRGEGFRVWRLEQRMGLHDAELLRFGQWWKRALRGGYAFAQGASLHGAAPENHCVRESRRIWIWGLGLPLAIAALSPWIGIWALAVAGLYGAQVIRIAARERHRLTRRERWGRAAFLVLAKFPEMLGQIKFHMRRYAGGGARLIEYK